MILCHRRFGAGEGGIAQFKVSLFGVPSVFPCGIPVVEVFSGEEIGSSGGLVVNESVG